VTVQNRDNVVERTSEAVLNLCADEGLGFIPWNPLPRGGDVNKGTLDRVAHELGTTPPQLALASLLRHAPVLLPTPGTSTVPHLEEKHRGGEPGAN
jgi:pyridoxine 4-dehydrogenase